MMGCAYILRIIKRLCYNSKGLVHWVLPGSGDHHWFSHTRQNLPPHSSTYKCSGIHHVPLPFPYLLDHLLPPCILQYLLSTVQICSMYCKDDDAACYAKLNPQEKHVTLADNRGTTQAATRPSKSAEAAVMIGAWVGPYKQKQ